jgi:glycine cleavage system H protein
MGSMETPNDLKYTEEHEWVRVEGNTAFIGITDYAQGELGDIVFVELPEAGAEVKQGETFGTIEAVKTVSDLYAPVTGTIAEINGDLEDHPEQINKSPYADGWMLKIELNDPAELESLLDADAYRSHVGEGD